MTDNKATMLQGAMRAGYAARGVVYLIIGALALYAAFAGGQAEGSSGALTFLSRQPFGAVLLSIVAAGLFAYALWRFVDAAMDLENEGSDGEGVGSRIGQALSGATHVVLGISAITIITSGGSSSNSGGGGSTEDWTAQHMQSEIGRVAVIVAGVVTLGVGVYLFIKAYREKWKEKMRNTQTTERLAPVVKYGLFAHGAVLLLVGGLIAWAGLSAEPQKAAGIGEALRILENQPFGRALLGLAGAGLVAFSAYCFVQAAYRIVPKLASGDLRTLAG